MRKALPSSRMPTTVVMLMLAVITLTGCGSDGSDDVTSSPDETAADVDTGDVPPECKVVYPAAFGTPDIADVQMLPASWPAPPAGSTLCQTSETVGGSREEADYATDLPPAEVFAAYEQALDPSFEVSRDTSGLGDEVLVGVADGVDFQISADEGKFSIALAK